MARLMKTSILVLVSAAMFAVSVSASAGGRHHRHHHHGARIGVGVVFGAPLWYPAPLYYPYYRPYYYAAPAPAPVYIERDRDVAESSPYWYFCRESDAYYPYVKQCPGPWQRVPAQPAH